MSLRQGDRQVTSAAGSTLERPALAPLVLSTKARVWGDAASGALEPLSTSPQDRAKRDAVMRRHEHRCMFCGLQSLANEVHNRNDNHRDVRDENLAVADSICHRWSHLGQLRNGEGVIVYLPGMSGRDVSHLLRTISIALQCDVQATRVQAKRLLNWMTSHHEYVCRGWGASDPATFAAALSRTTQEDPVRRAIALENLALVINPKLIEPAVRQWSVELCARWPVTTWPEVAHHVLHAPA